MQILLAILPLVALLGLLYAGRGWLAWVVAAGLALVLFPIGGLMPVWLAVVIGVPLVALAVITGRPTLRTQLISRRVIGPLGKILPRMSATEREALEAGTVWWDGELFSGNPDWRQLLDFRVAPLSEAEREFLDGPVEELCRMCDDWQIRQRGDLPEDILDFIKKKGLMGMIIPEEFGGLAFSAAMNSAVVTKVSSRSVTAAVTIMVPNSLGPAELLHLYGTPEQKKHYLPRLASGEEVPCFALTEPHAGSDAGSMRSEGVVCRDTWEGEEVVGIRLDWDKRYITLSTICTLVGLAFKLRDPDHLLGDEENLGITCALIPADAPGVMTGPRHDPMGVPFYNGPTTGKDVFVPLDAIIGGPEMAGKGWTMLMQCLSAGRGISLPALAVGASQFATRVVGAYASVREQFGLPIGRFEGIEERLARAGGLTYAVDAARTLTHGAVDSGEKPAVVSAILKAYSTEAMRTVVNDAMDVQGGAGLCRGPRNSLAGAYQALPIGITVEGANILTRSMIIYGQGAIRCHPWVQKEMQAVADRDLQAFDRAFFGHVGFFFQNTARAFVLGLTGGAAGPVPAKRVGRYFQQLTRFSAAFALISDAAMATLGGTLKRREKVTGRFADALAWMYIGSAALKRFCDDGQPARDLPAVCWASEHALHEIQTALAGILDNLPSRPTAWALRLAVFPLGLRVKPPSDRLGSLVARGLLEDGELRTSLSRDIFVPESGEPGLGQLEDALAKMVEAREARKKVKDALRARRVEPGPDLLERLRSAGILSAAEVERIEAANAAQHEAVLVDAFGDERTNDKPTPRRSAKVTSST